MKTNVLKLIHEDMLSGKELLDNIQKQYSFADERTLKILQNPMNKVTGQIESLEAVIIQPEEDQVGARQVSNYAFVNNYQIPPVQLACILLHKIGLKGFREMGYTQWIVIMSKTLVDGDSLGNMRVAINLLEGDPLVLLYDYYESNRHWNKNNAFVYVNSLILSNI
jgi:hypothetical protein